VLKVLLNSNQSIILQAGTGELPAVKMKHQGAKFMSMSETPELKTQLVRDLAESSVLKSQ